jgi:L-ascorbate metabolism protein UlaG (beta-lactamase superfamily)
MQPLLVRGRYVNVGAPRAEPGGDDESQFRKFLKWRRERRGLPRLPFHVPKVPVRAPLGPPPAAGIAATWAGHSSVVLQVDGKTYLTDPVWSDRVGSVVKRLTPPGLPWEALPRVDGLLVSHNHYDHLDAGTVARLPRATPVFCPTGVAAWFRRRGFTRVHERSWWEAAELDGHRLTCVPAQHFSGRTPWDRDKTLWGGWVVEGSRGGRAYFAGDSGYFKGFAEIGAAFPRLDLAMVPIGAYTPRWFMSPVHVDPAEAGQALLDVGARSLLPIHWGTFRLADEAIDEPPKVLLGWWREKGLDPARLRVPALGETLTFGAAQETLPPAP